MFHRTDCAPGSDVVRLVKVPAVIRSQSTLDRIDYADAFRFAVGDPSASPAEYWARQVLCGAPAEMRARLVAGWSAIGLKLTRGAGSILGWTVRRSSRDLALLHAGSRIGMPAELVFRRERHSLVFATLVSHPTLAGRATWAATEPIHARVVPSLLAEAGRRLDVHPPA